MKKITFIVVFVACVFLCLPAVNGAMLSVGLLYPDILSNQTGFYADTRDSDSQEGPFTARALPPTIHWAGLDLQPITGENRSYEVSFYLAGSGDFRRGLGGSDQSDLVINGDGEVLLTGEVINFGWKNIENTKLVLYDFTFGGTLAPEFESGLGRDIALAENSNFADDWQLNQQSIKIKHDTAAVNPIPATAWLLGAGLIGMVTLRRRFNS